MRPPFPLAVDSSMRQSFVSCPRKYELNYLHDWRPRDTSVHLHAGGAFAYGIEQTRRAAYDRNLPHDEAIGEGLKALMKYYGTFEPPENSVKDLPGMCIALIEYFDHFGTQTDSIIPVRLADKGAIEFTFALPIDPALLHPTTGDPILYTGRTDMLGKFVNGPDEYEGVWPVDEKTTSQMGPSWSKQWELKSQLTGYVWASREYGFQCPGAIVRGISVQKKDTKFGQFLAFRPPWMVERWRQQLIRDVKRMIECWREGYFDYNIDHSCSDFGGCPFLQVCTSNYPQRWLESHYHQVHWDPMTRTEKLITVTEKVNA